MGIYRAGSGIVSGLKFGGANLILFFSQGLSQTSSDDRGRNEMEGDWMKIHTSDEGYNHEIEVEDRQMVLSSAALGILRQQLARNIGIERIKGFLIRFGWEMGVND